MFPPSTFVVHKFYNVVGKVAAKKSSSLSLSPPDPPKTEAAMITVT